jgi:lsr operon transcriptional repressor
MIGRVAALHYIHGLNHQEVADLVGLSRVQVTRLLAKARAEGIVEIRVNSDEAIFPELQFALQERFNLEQIWVAPSFKEADETSDSIGAVGAKYLRTALKPGMVVAVGLSATLDLIAPHLGKDPLDVTFVPAIGSRPSSHASVNPHEVASSLAEAVSGSATFFPAPFLASSPESAKTMRAEPDVALALKLARKADLAIFGIGGVNRGAGILLDTIGTEEFVNKLLADGAVGDISAAYFDAQGKSVASSMDNKIVGLNMKEILEIPKRVAFAGGKDKVKAIATAASSGLITALVTDIDTAQKLLEFKR